MSTEREYHETYRLHSIRVDGDTHARAKLDQATVREYAEQIDAGVELPPVLVFFDGTDYWLADGFYRWHAHDRMARASIRCLVRKGSREDAQWVAIAANQTHGLRRSNADKAVAVRRALEHPDGAGLSNGQIAEHVGVSDEFVRKQRQAMESDGSLPTVGSRVGRDGRTIDVSQIGKAVVRDPGEGKPAKNLDVAPGPSGSPDSPNCGGCEFHEDGVCRPCLEPCAQLVGCEPPTEDKPASPETAKDAIWREVETIVGSWLVDHPEDRAAAAARLENLADMIRSGIVFA